MLNQNIYGVRARVNQPAIKPAKSHVRHFAVIRKALVQPCDGQVAHLTGNELAPHTERHGGCRSRDLREALVDGVAVATDGVWGVVLHSGHPQRATELVDARFEVSQSLIAEHELRAATVGRVNGVDQINQVLVADAVCTSVLDDGVVVERASSGHSGRARRSDGRQNAEGRIRTRAKRQVILIATSQADGESVLQEALKTECGILHQFERYADKAGRALVSAEAYGTSQHVAGVSGRCGCALNRIVRGGTIVDDLRGFGQQGPSLVRVV